jgi:hypothetical protein
MWMRKHEIAAQHRMGAFHFGADATPLARATLYKKEMHVQF